MMYVACGQMSCTSNLALESMLSRRSQVQYGFMLQLILLGGKNNGYSIASKTNCAVSSVGSKGYRGKGVGGVGG